MERLRVAITEFLYNRELFDGEDDSELKCPRCRLIFTSSDRKPHHLPCNIEHILCSQCIRDLLESSDAGEIQCNKCFEIHEADRGPNSFHIMTDILSTVRHIGREAVRIMAYVQDIDLRPLTYRMCAEHNKPIEYYCVSARCSDRSAMCITCLARHSNIAQPHYWINIRDFVKSTIRYQVNRGITFLERALQTPNRD